MVILVLVLIIHGVTSVLWVLAGYSLKKISCLPLATGLIWVSYVCHGVPTVTVNSAMYILHWLTWLWQEETWCTTRMVIPMWLIRFIWAVWLLLTWNGKRQKHGTLVWTFLSLTEDWQLTWIIISRRPLTWLWVSVCRISLVLVLLWLTWVKYRTKVLKSHLILPIFRTRTLLGILL